MNLSPDVANTLPEQARSLLTPPSVDACERVLCVQPHPDDNEIGMGGTVAKLAARGCRVDYLTVTDGRLGTKDAAIAPDDLAETRRAETHAAADILGVSERVFLDLPDGGLNDVRALADAIARIIRMGGYDAVFCPDPYNPYEAHLDHIAVGRAVAHAAVSYDLAAYARIDGAQAPRLAAVGFYFTAHPNTVVDVSEFLDMRAAAMAAHASQMDEATLQTFCLYLSLRGRMLAGGEREGEGFKMLSPLHLHCFPEAGEL